MPSKASGKTDLSTRPPYRVVGSNISKAGARNKPPSDPPHMPVDPGPSDLSSSSHYTAPPLHFHGLAVTQTQTQVASSAETTGESDARRESRAVKRKKVSQDSVPYMSPKAPQKASNSNELSETRPASPSGSKLKRRRSPSVTSADSFAGPEEWEDPARVFLTSNRQFEVPLSELGRRATQGEFQEGHHSIARTPPRPTVREPTQVDLSLIEGSSASGLVATKVQQPGVKSDGALSQVSDVSTGAQRRNRSPVFDISDDASTPPVMSNPGSMDYLDARAEDYPATQPLAPDVQDINTTQVSHVIESQQTQTSPNSESSNASRPPRNTRNILSMVNPEKKWRLQRGELLLQAALQNEPDGQTQPSATVPGSSYVPSTGRKLFDQLAAKMVVEQQSSPRDLPPLDEDSREAVIVPDSEPPESANVSSTSAQPQLLTPPKDSLRVDSSFSRPTLVPSMAVEDEDRRRRNEKGDKTDDDDDEEDIPLRLTARRPDVGAAPPSTKVNNPRGLKRKTVETKTPNTRGIFPRDNEIPSSVPEQDHRSSVVPPSPKRTRREGKERKDTGEDVFIPGGRSDQVTPAPDEVSTEPADDLPMNIENDAPALQDPKPSSKRKRPPVTRRKAAYKSAPRMASNTPSMLSGTRSTKKIKSHHPTATRVFALWKSDAAYFSGIVCEQAGQSDRFKILFDDGDEDLVDVKNLRRLELRIGDRVSIVESKEKATVVNVDGQHQGIVTVRLADEPSAELEVEVLGLKIQSRAIRSQWDNRTINADGIVTLVPRTKRETPSSLRNSSASLNKKALSKVGIVVTLSVGLDWEKEKETITKIIRTNGGTVLDDWSDIFSLVGEYSSNKKRWVITSDNISTEMKDDIQQVFLVSDAANAKPRFLTALALGIPCLSVEWLRCLSSSQCIISDWPSYLLPAGYSDSLGARVTQMVDLDWGSTLDHLTGIMSNNVATKLFSEKSVLVLGPEYFPPPAKGKKGTSAVVDEKSNDGGRFIPRIIVSMGAARVEAVPELKYSSDPDLNDFHYVVVKDLHERPSVGGEKFVSMEWVKDCLIAGRMFPPRV